ncbi:Hsp20/alpha crystallin family protein [Desulfosporosinus youngiae]|uniref:Molecular chaperone (Small heat shock protein) n=1 Tax=Desulfosporosinus youngiae DSM 17734 TaxID=768710 RepID=H5Y3I8_9FIRM|nr:Hsp20/alpha crystallin family protein [Desulfosporosinus youngiae]EHQ89097.1 molecular chaperone (small heat shock protein) [Desulfosporosinus youngiae DSM 17734]
MFDIVPFARRSSGIQKYNNLFDLEGIFEGFFNDRHFPSLYKNSAQMKVDVKENENEFILEAELPGIKKEDVNLQIDDDRLTISVQKNEQTEEEKDNYIRRERNYSSMTRSFVIPNVETDNVNAKFENGLLFITLPKKQEKAIKGKQIEID